MRGAFYAAHCRCIFVGGWVQRCCCNITEEEEEQHDVLSRFLSFNLRWVMHRKRKEKKHSPFCGRSHFNYFKSRMHIPTGTWHIFLKKSAEYLRKCFVCVQHWRWSFWARRHLSSLLFLFLFAQLKVKEEERRKGEEERPRQEEWSFITEPKGAKFAK